MRNVEDVLMGGIVLFLFMASLSLLGLTVWLIFAVSWTFLFGIPMVMVLVLCFAMGLKMTVEEWKEGR